MVDSELMFPWERKPLDEWAIAGMNHYFVEGVKHLYVLMVRQGVCIKAEGPSDLIVWEELQARALKMDADDWHDLRENPEDLPEDGKLVSIVQECMVSVFEGSYSKVQRCWYTAHVKVTPPVGWHPQVTLTKPDRFNKEQV